MLVLHLFSVCIWCQYVTVCTKNLPGDGGILLGFNLSYVKAWRNWVKILIDENMPYAQELFSRLGEVVLVSGRSFPRELFWGANALMVRSVTEVNQALLAGTEVNFVGTATAGIDHVDKVWLQEAGIGFSAAPGCNATAVVEYVLSALLFLAEREGFELSEKTVGIIGVGNVGSRLAHCLQALGVPTLLCDPPRVAQEGSKAFSPLEQLVKEADILTLHTPLNSEGDYRTYHLIDDSLLAALPDDRILINTARGAIVDNTALLQALEKGKKIQVILDVWETEPFPCLPLLARTDIATPHIAGYSLEGKARGTTQIFTAYSAFLGEVQQVVLGDLLPRAHFAFLQLQGQLDQAKLKKLIHLVYDIRQDDYSLRRVAAQQGAFDRLRKDYHKRREWSSLCVQCDHQDSYNLLKKIGFSVC